MDAAIPAKPMRGRCAGPAFCLILALSAAGCTARDPAPTSAPAGTIRERIAALALRQSDFGSVSLLPVRFEHSRISGPFEDAGRTLYCVSSRMRGRTFDKGERPKVVIRDEGGILKVLQDEEEVCTGHRTQPFPELETMAATRS